MTTDQANSSSILTQFSTGGKGAKATTGNVYGKQILQTTVVLHTTFTVHTKCFFNFQLLFPSKWRKIEVTCEDVPAQFLLAGFSASFNSFYHLLQKNPVNELVESTSSRPFLLNQNDFHFSFFIAMQHQFLFNFKQNLLMYTQMLFFVGCTYTLDYHLPLNH